MKSIFRLCFLLSLLFTGCLETEQTTTINADGSGTYHAVLNMGTLLQVYKLASQMKKEEDSMVKEEPPLVKDTLIYMRSYSDTSSTLSAKEKELIQDMTLSLKIDSENDIFRIQTNCPFTSLANLDLVTKLTTRKEFDKVFDEAMKLPGLTDEGDKNEPALPGYENDNIFDLLSPDIFDCRHQSGNIVCRVNAAKHQATLRKMKKSGMDIARKENRQMLSQVTFSSHYVLPAKAKLITGVTLKNTGSNKYTQSGNLYDLYKNPKKYEYTIKY
jgi:hypothetical protein